ncbi:MAG: ribonuclease PH [Oligoflexia bacterium]|nr:ribonuclease PH [Oligoflexia bacterium]
MRLDQRSLDALRAIKITPNYTAYAEGSCLVEFGKTKVICTASIEPGVPQWLKGTGKGWVTAEYGMLPRSTHTRMKRDKAASSGRTQEIQRLIGRSLRAVTDLAILGERQVVVDCDVIQADGGTRTASITGGFVALALAFKGHLDQKLLLSLPLKDYVAAVSCGIVNGSACLDLAYEEDSAAEVDMNFVLTGSDHFVELQGTAEHNPFSEAQLSEMTHLARKGIRELFSIQSKILGGFFPLQNKS